MPTVITATCDQTGNACSSHLGSVRGTWGHVAGGWPCEGCREPQPPAPRRFWGLPARDSELGFLFLEFGVNPSVIRETLWTSWKVSVGQLRVTHGEF